MGNEGLVMDHRQEHAFPGEPGQGPAGEPIEAPGGIEGS